MKVLPVSACVMTNATPGGGAMDTGGEVGVAGGVLGAGRSGDGLPFGEGVSLRAGSGGTTEATAVGVTTAVAVGTVVVGDGDAEGPLALRCCVQPARATSAATTAQHPARYRTMPAVASLPAVPH